jgi:hypothetical protein
MARCRKHHVTGGDRRTMEPSLQLVLTVGLESKFAAIGSFSTGGNVLACPLQVGDFIPHPTVPSVFARVRSRVFRQATPTVPAQWYVILEEAHDPFTPPESASPPR